MAICRSRGHRYFVFVECEESETHEERSKGMSSNGKVLVVGLGEIGKPLLGVLSKRYETVGIDIAPPLDLPQQVTMLFE